MFVESNSTVNYKGLESTHLLFTKTISMKKYKMFYHEQDIQPTSSQVTNTGLEMPASLQHVPDNIKCEIQYRTSLEEFLKFQIKNSYTMKKFWGFFPFKLKYIANFIQLRIKNACD